MPETFTIVGANLAGGRAAQALRNEGFEGEIILIGAEPYPPYERPPLSKEVLLGHFEPEQAYLQSEEKWAEQGITLRLSSLVTNVLRASKEVELSDGERIRADKLLLCTGGRVRQLYLPGVELNGVQYLRTIDDALSIRQKLIPGSSVVVIGGGFIGAEVVACANQAGCTVTLVEIEDVPLWRVFGRELGEILTQFHRDHGVDVMTRTSVESIEGDGSVRGVLTEAGKLIPADMVVIGVGLEPAIELAEIAGAEITNGIVVNEFCETTVNGIYAAGDVAYHPNSILGEHVRLEHWQNAQNQALAAARSMLGHREEFREVPWFWSDQYDLNIQMSGHPSAHDEIVYRGDTSSSSFSAFYVREGVLSGVVGVNRTRDVRRTMRLIEKHQVINVSELTDESTDLSKIGL